MTKLNKILLTILLVMAIIVYCAFDAILWAPQRFITRNETLKSSRIPEQLNDMRILFFSDLDFGKNMDEKRLESLVSQINSLSADVILFGGDLYDDVTTVNEENNEILVTALSNLNAYYGKYAVYGDFDELTDERKNAINTIYASSGFEILNNYSVNIHKQGSDSITLIGLNNGINGEQNIEQAYSSVSRDSYVITLCHTPDTVDTVPLDLTNYFLAGHSLGGQIYYYFGAYYQPLMAKKYFRGTHTVQNTTLDITNGVGTHGSDVRFLSDSEIVVYTLQNEKVKPTSTPTPTSSSTSDHPTDSSSTQ